MSTFACMPGKVYFARVGDYVKIGYSADPARRVRRLMTGKIAFPDDIDMAAEVELVHLIDGCRIRDERTLHALFAAHHVIGEWFRYDASFRLHLAGLNYQTYEERCAHRRLVKRRNYRLVESADTELGGAA